MSNLIKRIIVIIVAILLVGVIIFGVVRFISNEEAGEPTPQPTTTQPASPPEPGTIEGNQNRDLQPNAVQPNQSRAATTSPNLSRSGPEHIALLFILVTVSAYAISLRIIAGKQRV